MNYTHDNFPYRDQALQRTNITDGDEKLMRRWESDQKLMYNNNNNYSSMSNIKNGSDFRFFDLNEDMYIGADLKPSEIREHERIIQGANDVMIMCEEAKLCSRDHGLDDTAEINNISKDIMNWESDELRSDDDDDDDDEDEERGKQVVQLLVSCASAVAETNKEAAAESLGELYRVISFSGDSIQRVGAHFAEALTARLLTKASPFYKSMMKEPNPHHRLSALTHLCRVSPFYQFAHFTANQTITEAFQAHHFVHVIDFDILHGFQWPSLMQSLATRPGGPPSLRIIGLGRNERELEQTGIRLTNFATHCGIKCFEFRGFLEGSNYITRENLGIGYSEALAVNCVFYLHRLLTSGSGENICRVLNSIQRLKPSVVMLVEQEANHNADTFLGRFAEALPYYAAMFDSLDACLPCESEERARIEKALLGPQIKNIITCEDTERTERHQKFDMWKLRMEASGFRQLYLSSHSVSQAKLLLQLHSYSGFAVLHMDGALYLGWHQRHLITASAWRLNSSSFP
eukprot:Gb_20415 [translate_table: standard]